MLSIASSRDNSRICDCLAPGQLCAHPVHMDGSRASVLGCYLSLRGDPRCLVYLARCPPTNAASWSEHYTVHGLPAAALTQALSKLMHP